MHTDIRCRSIRRQFGDGLLIVFRGRMKQVDLWRVKPIRMRLALQRDVLHTCDERCDPDTPTDPYLPWLHVIEIETAIGPFDRHGLPDAELFPQPVSVIAQFLVTKVMRRSLSFHPDAMV